MAIQMELYELKNLCMEMASLGAANYVKQTIPAKDLISQREAYRLFQECRVKRWWKIQCKLPPKTKRFCPLVLK